MIYLILFPSINLETFTVFDVSILPLRGKTLWLKIQDHRPNATFEAVFCWFTTCLNPFEPACGNWELPYKHLALLLPLKRQKTHPHWVIPWCGTFGLSWSWEGSCSFHFAKSQLPLAYFFPWLAMSALSWAVILSPWPLSSINPRGPWDLIFERFIVSYWVF